MLISIISKIIEDIFNFHHHLNLLIIKYSMKGLITIGLLVLSNVFMTLAWYGHLKFKELRWFEFRPIK